MGQHFFNIDEAIDYCRRVFEEKIRGKGLLVEEKLAGQEFSLQVSNDGYTLSAMPLVRDYKRAYEGDFGPNTGSMGSYSNKDGLLPYITKIDRDQAL